MSITKIPNPILSTPSKPVTEFDASLKKMIDVMKQTLLSARDPKGVGLAGPQAGFPYRIFLTKPSDKDPIRVCINPDIIASSKETTDGVPERDNKLEGCLSVPNVWGKVKRRKSITLSYQDEKGVRHTEQFKGFLATIIQHETDHVNGVLFTQRVLEQHGTFYQSIKDPDGKERLEKIELI